MASTKFRTAVPARQADLFGTAADLPAGFLYRPELITPDEENLLVRHMGDLPFKPFDFHGHLANRQVVGFGLRYDYDTREVVEAAAIPDFLFPLREKVADLAGRQAAEFCQVLINWYQPGAGIGWHRDKPQFELIAGVSLLASCSFRLRRKNGTTWDRETIEIEPRSAYLMSGSARNEWEHSIPSVAQPRYSVTLRTLRPDL
ncbi:MAG: alpha-ketoglutarate-dependent dioxygenase AlkB [Mesorhizobium sp.]|nr:alpha-ketoglutarate-dependent dioxygenase AlkB [bacterium M00.F.Ca.ET.205.01.1.1]TGU46642.1 alpha-ketoglutarate-dependent dioxygenase AlkB [bacterium M00.F.Ca.ET.152.01.1.1]TGV31735.1 alpha-ketoglutarate-dependent dioxygenase AlkB [Mesorhizobium sp. M00.F.Ca.ET.186.01.1.1]TGZ38910.1 alpha-ketoglutarate-dependent dioxygenase AlkB [bacterium M00.F.Ca.ET.162.01.1.1]TJW32318.1 MAG: alpha-ketoglutarate-dependent dioxygenase AlkB [Mesorhizobium sp.]